MRVSRHTIAVGLVAAAMAACSSAPSEPPGGADDGGGGSSSGPATSIAPMVSPAGDAGGNSGGGTGQIHIDIGGPAQSTVDLPFFSFGSRFDGDVAGVQLNFTSEGATGIASITGVSDSFVIGYVGDDLSANAQTCTLTDWTIGTTSASGSFDCTEGFGTTPDGTYLSDITMKGSFEANQ